MLSRALPHFRLLASVLAVVLMLGWAGCGDSERFSYASEIDEPNYREGQSLLKAGRRQEARTAFLKVIDKRRDDAPESHLEVGLLYAQHINDPLSAIYHFRKYLALRPNSPQAPLVRQRIDAAIRDFARTLPAQPLDSNQPQRVDLVATLDRLKQENEALKQQLADTRAGRGLPALAATAAPAGDAPAPAGETVSFSVDAAAEPTVRTRPSPTTPMRPAPPVVSTSTPTVSRSTPAPATVRPAPAPTRTTAPVTAPTAGARRHTIRPGDTLSKLAQQYYNNRAKWRDIYAANRDVMKNETDLKAGTVLKIPWIGPARATCAAAAGSPVNFGPEPNLCTARIVGRGMNKPMSLALLVIGAILLFYGFQAGDSVGSDVSRAVSGTPTDKTIWFLVGGAISGLVGLVGLIRGSGSLR